MSQGTIPIEGLSKDASTAVVVNLVFSSLWMGALGWDLLMSLSFDYRLAVETRWRSGLSALHSIAYFLSRYATLTYIVLYVAANSRSSPAMSQDMCQRRVIASAVFFVLSQSSIILIFVMRTLALWNLDARVVWLLSLAWLAMVGLELTMPIKANGVIISDFCTWSINGFYVGASMTSLAVVSCLCMVLTILKLNKQGWRGAFKSVLPRKTHSIDSEEVSAMLVQRTTIFSVILICVIALADVVYFSATFVVYQLMTVTAYLAIASSLAGRIFRRSWKLTRSAYYQRPPNYFPEWVRPNDMLLDAQSQSHSHSQHRISSDDSLTFVEGEFRAGPSSSAKSLILPLRGEKEKTPAQIFADEHGRSMSEGDGPDAVITDSSYDPTTPGMPSQDDSMRPHFARNIPRRASEPSVYERDYASPGIAGAPPPPAKIVQQLSARSSRLSRSRDGNASKFVLPFGSRESFKLDKHRFKRPMTDPTTEQRSEKAALADALGTRPATSANEDISPKQKVDTLYADEERDAQRRAQQPATVPRDDLVSTKAQPRLWLDSSAERARMEAATSLGLTLAGTNDLDGTTPYTPSFASSSHQSLSSTGAYAGRRDMAVRRSMRRPSALGSSALTDDNESAAPRSRGNSQSHVAFESSSASTSRPSTATRRQSRVGSPLEPAMRRGSFLASPAIQPGIPATSDRKVYDIDAIKQSVSSAVQQWRPSTAESGRLGTFGEGGEYSRPSLSLPPSPRNRAREEWSNEAKAGAGGPSVEPALRRGEKRLLSDAPLPESRPRTAPNKAPHAAMPSTSGRRGSAGTLPTALTQSLSSPEAPAAAAAPTNDALAAFREVVESDSENASRTLDASRPRTSRGGPLGSFGEVRRDSATSSSNQHDDGSSGDGHVARSPSNEHSRPPTSDGTQAAVKPFGSGIMSASARNAMSGAASAAPPTLSAIDEQYRRLAAFVDQDGNSSAKDG